MLAFSSCGGSGQLAAADASADAVPDRSIDPAIWSQLTSELASVIVQEGTARRTAAAPTGFGSRVPDLTVHEAGGQAVFTWSYRQHGDYDLNGEVNVSDLTQVGVHFGKTTLDDDWQIAQLADGDGNGEVGVSDVTPIGQNFGGRIDGYELQGRINPDSEYLLKGELASAPGDKLSGLYPQYALAFPPLPVGPEYRVVPYVDSGGERSYGTESNLYQTLHNLDLHWHTKNGSNYRDNLAPAVGPSTDPEAWQVALDGDVFLQQPIIGAVDSIYIGTFSDSVGGLEFTGTGYMYCISRAGEVSWRFATQDGIVSSAAASRSGRVVFGDAGGRAYCLAPDGKQLWRRQLPGLLMLASPLIDDIGTTFIVTHTISGESLAASTLYKLLPDGSIDWSRPLNDSCLMSPFLNSQNEVTVVDGNSELYSFDYDGVATQNFMLPDPPLSGGFLGYNIAIRDVAIAYSTSNDSVRVVLEDNSFTGAIVLGEEAITGPVLTNDNDIVLGTKTLAPDPVFKLNHYTGNVENWDMIIPGNLLTGIAVDQADQMYISTYFLNEVAPPGTNGVSCVLPDQTVAWFYPSGDAVPFAPVVADDNLVLCVLGGSLFTSEGNSSLMGISGS